MKDVLVQSENRVNRTYTGGKLIDEFLGKQSPADSSKPEDWISSFVEAKNKEYLEKEGLSRVKLNGEEYLLSDIIKAEDFGEGRSESGVLIKLLDSAERLGIQVHPTPEFSKKHFGTNYGKTECWHILKTREESDACVYIGFKKGISEAKWRELFDKQDINGMLGCLHRFSVKPGDTVLVRAGTPHAIGAGCFLLEIQEPSDYTMRVETTTVRGEKLTPMQISYGLSTDALFECFIYEGLSESDARDKYFLKARVSGNTHTLVDYSDTPCFALDKITGEGEIRTDCFSTVIALSDGELTVDGKAVKFKKADKIFIRYGNSRISVKADGAIICYPPKK